MSKNLTEDIHKTCIFLQYTEGNELLLYENYNLQTFYTSTRWRDIRNFYIVFPIINDPT